jgi:tetratricopeptide (TPR) repeat protein
VAARIAQSLAMELVPGQRDLLARVNPRKAEAYQTYLKGRFHWNRTGDEGLTSAIAYYERALDLDPGFATAHAAMARGQIALAEFSHESGRVVFQRARASALRSLELDPGAAEAYVALAEVHKGLEWNWPVAESTYRKALSLASSCDAAHRYYAIFLAAMSRHVEARQEATRAADVDPMCLAANTCGAWIGYVAGEFDEAIEQCIHTLDMDPSYTLARRLLGAAYVAVGKLGEGIAELEKAAQDDCAQSVSLAWLAHAKAVAGQRDAASTLVDRLNGMRKDCYVPSYHMALAYAGLGDCDSVFAQLAAACDERDPAVVQVAVEPRFAPLRADSRFAALLSRLSLPSSAGIS